MLGLGLYMSGDRDHALQTAYSAIDSSQSGMSRDAAAKKAVESTTADWFRPVVQDGTYKQTAGLVLAFLPLSLLAGYAIRREGRRYP